MYTLKVKGMTCGHCAQTVTRALEAMPEVERALVDLDRGEVTVEGKADPMMLTRAITEAGYEVADA
ncbi:CopZ family metallochaperone [Azospirillum rugosum]|uniref:Copper chaperone n=1 Tax=Azospirillum rugosum TaxID=416170 RepID=A0ABS4SFY1_9PROT|nr:heavy metal-associated domain-containing protein [Azospirillum rugosum]MBP2291417.1 copper chaperone [Azospirillum rugosum]MDQ0525205.1 copper chaperone [Azospirillum rugosum]